MSTPASSIPTNSGAFTLWLDPARWPVVPFRLPGKAFTLWINPRAWPAQAFRLPGQAFTVWLDPARWPVRPYRLPGAGFTLWLDPASWPEPPVFVEHTPAPHVETTVDAGLPPLPEVAEVVLPVVPEMPVSPSPSPMPISLSQNKAFTLWTRPTLVSPIPMKNGLTAAQVAAPTPADAAPALQAASVPSGNVQVPAPPLVKVGLAERWFPLAAAVVAIMGINSLMQVSDKKIMTADKADVTKANLLIGDATQKLSAMQARVDAASKDSASKIAGLEAQAGVVKKQNDLLVTDLAKAMEAGKKAAARMMEQETAISHLSKELEQAKVLAETAGTAAEAKAVMAQEETSKIKRESGAALVGLQESLGKLEAEKAAAVKAAADAGAALAALQAKWDALPKPAP